MTDNKLQVETTERELILTRTFDAPRELVFSAFSSCEHLRNWWGPRPWPMVECTIDFRPGGIWHYCLRGPNEGDAAWGRVDYEQIVEPERIVYRDSFSDAEANINPDLPQARVSYEFAAVEGKTLLTSRTEYPTPDGLQQVLEMGVVEGISETLDRLEEHLAKTVEAEQ